MTREEKSGCLFCFWLCVKCVVVWLCVFLLSCVWLFGCIMVCMVRLWCPIRLFGLPSAAKLSRESRGYLLVLADLTHLWGGIFIGTTGTKVSIFHIFHVICIDVHFYDKIFRIFQICDILLVDEWQYILSLVICSIIQHWWLILIVGGWLIVAMLQYVMAAHTDPSPAATSSAAPSHLILLFLHSHLLVLNMKANVMLFFSLQFHWFWTSNFLDPMWIFTPVCKYRNSIGPRLPDGKLCN